MNLRLVIATATIVATRALPAQSASEHIARGDRERAGMNAAGALAHYQAALRVAPSSADALWRASTEAVELGEFNDGARDSLYRLAEQYARTAVEADPNSSMAHFALAKVLGRRALSLDVRERMEYAAAVREAALTSLKLDSLNAGALHVLALWHAHVMSVSVFSRAVAKHLLGARFVGEANWNDAVRLLERAAAIEPDRIVHRLDLARVYTDVKEIGKARDQYTLALRLTPAEFNDRTYQDYARRELNALP